MIIPVEVGSRRTTSRPPAMLRGAAKVKDFTQDFGPTDSFLHRLLRFTGTPSSPSIWAGSIRTLVLEEDAPFPCGAGTDFLPAPACPGAALTSPIRFRRERGAW